MRGSAPLSSLCLGSHKPRPGEPRLWGTGRQGPYQPSALGSARCPQVGIVEQPLNESTGEVEAWSPPVPSPATGPRPRQRPEPGRTTRDSGTEGLPGDSEQTCKLSEHGLRGGRRAVGQDHYLGTKDQFWRKGRDASARPQTPGQRRVVCTGHSTHRVGTPPPGATTAPDSPAPGVLGRCPTPGPAGSAARGSAAAGPTSAARMRRLFSSVQRSERTAGCARSSSAAASTQPAVHAAQASSAPRPHQPHRPRRQHRRGRLRAMTRRPRPDPPPAPRALPAAPRLCAAQRGRGRGGEAALGEGEALRPDCPRPARSGGGVGWSGRWPHPARPPGHGGKGCPLAAPGDRSLLALSTRRTPLPFPLFFFFTFSPKKTSSPS